MFTVYEYALEKGAQFSTAKMGIEWMSRCLVPGCSSQQDAFSVQPEGKLTGRWAGYGAWMCRKCWDPSEIIVDSGVPRKRGWGSIIDLVMACEHMTYAEAEEYVRSRGSAPSDTSGAAHQGRSPMSDEAWYEKFVSYTAEAWKQRECIAAYCATRGLKPETVSFLKFGFSVDPVKMKDGTFCRIPFLVIPWHKEDGSLYRKINRRNLHDPLPDDEDKYRVVQGCQHDELYLGYMLKQHKRPTLIVESELCAATIWQEAGDLVNVVATGSADHGRNVKNEARLRRQPIVFVAFDADAKGDEASKYWIEKLRDGTKCVRYRPLMHDVNEMHVSGMNVRKWIETGIAVHCAPTEEIEPLLAQVRSLARQIQQNSLYWYMPYGGRQEPVSVEEYCRRAQDCATSFHDGIEDELHIQIRRFLRKCALKTYQRVNTPLGAGLVLSVVYVEALGLVRCSVLLDQWQPDGTKWHTFDAAEVQPAAM
ncbi:MAG TPA: toprim domain-containing protein [Ktedonobacteraceae bacterium]|jgi:hypothetical protein